MRSLPNPNATVLKERCPRFGNLLLIRSASDLPQCASWVCEVRAFLAAQQARTA